MKIALTRAGLALGFIAAIGVTNFSQTPSPHTNEQIEQQRMERRRGRRHHRMGEFRLSALRQFSRAGLNLTDAQQQQLRQIEERAAQSTQAQRTELRGIFEQRAQGSTLTAEQRARAEALRNEMREVARRTREEALAVLTAEQRALLEQSRQQHRQQLQAGREQGVHRRRSMEMRGVRGLRELNLTEAQQQQINQIRERYAADIQAQRQALRQLMEERRQQQQGANNTGDAQTMAQRLEQLNEPIRRMRAEILAVLTPEQRTQFEQRQAERRARRGHRGERLRRRHQGQTPPSQGTTQP
jgi:Spy/CpxP family protein refolding chaperone